MKAAPGDDDARRTRLADRTLDILEAVGAAGTCSLPEVATRCDLALPTVHRLAGSLIERGYLIAYRRGLYGLGPASLALGRGLSFRDMLRQAGAPALQALARQARAHAHLGIYEGDMVTYLARVRYGRSALLTSEGTQLEAYCSGIGKILLAQLDDAALDRYLGEGAFVALTANTITDPAVLRDQLDAVRARGWATDLGEVAPDLACIAVPIVDGDGRGIAAISVSFGGVQHGEAELRPLVPMLRATADRIGAKLFPPRARA